KQHMLLFVGVHEGLEFTYLSAMHGDRQRQHPVRPPESNWAVRRLDYPPGWRGAIGIDQRWRDLNNLPGGIDQIDIYFPAVAAHSHERLFFLAVELRDS